MNEVEKMYENAGIEPDINYVCDKEPCEKHSVDCQECSHLYDTREDYPDFTAEKQIEIIKWLGELDMLEIIRTTREDKAWIINSEFGMSGNVYKHTSRKKSFEEALASLVNSLWQDLTNQEKEEIRNILNA